MLVHAEEARFCPEASARNRAPASSVLDTRAGADAHTHGPPGFLGDAGGRDFACQLAQVSGPGGGPPQHKPVTVSPLTRPRASSKGPLPQAIKVGLLHLIELILQVRLVLNLTFN
jgi:hypothetical protein